MRPQLVDQHIEHAPIQAWGYDSYRAIRETVVVPEDSSYVIQSGADAHDRLELIARLFWPTTETFLDRTGAFEATRFLDVGCGIGDVACRVGAPGIDALGIDVNAEVITMAAARAAEHDAPADFRVAGLAELGAGDLVDADAVYARCVLTHQSDPETGLERMLAAVRPGGLVLVEDVEVAAVWSSPPNDALRRHLELYVAAAHGLGARPDFACEIAPTLAALGATDIQIDVLLPVLRTPDEVRAHACTMQAIARPVVDQGLATPDEVDALVEQLDAFADEPGAVATLPRVVQVSARAPA
jgi:2-polyprenyl-3-methyl-5-hydroxy-6-metoxy-1,4-benzoquinol methylase